MHADLRIDDEQQQVGLVDRLVHLPPDLDVHRHARIVGDAAGVDEPELRGRPFGSREMAVARRARLLADDRAVVADDAVEERRLPDVRPADERDDRNVHAATAASRGSPS